MIHHLGKAFDFDLALVRDFVNDVKAQELHRIFDGLRLYTDDLEPTRGDGEECVGEEAEEKLGIY
jgi:hypothetical protein